MSEILFEELLPAGASWSHVLKRGTSLRITDVEGGANCGALFYNWENFAERYNMPDTLKAQHIARLTTGNVLFTDMGRILCSVITDSVGWHDPLSGCAGGRLIAEKYGEANYQQYRNDYYKNALDSFHIEIAKYGMTPRDMTAVLNFFSKVVVDEGGAMTFVPGNSKAGDAVELRAEMNTLVVLNTCPHPLDTNPAYAPKPVLLSIRKVPPPGPDDPCRISRPENGRGFILTERYHL
jgi:uncharacterized protein